MEAQSASDTAVIEVRFKGARKEYFRHAETLPIVPGDYCVVQVERGKDCGKVVQTGLISAMKAAERPVGEVVRRATHEDMSTFWENAEKETFAQRFCLERIVVRNLQMKLVDVEWQFDSSKVTFYFTAERRVDFRELVKDLAAEFRTRIELRQIGVRDEAKRKDGYGSCGRRLCCSSWLPEFQPITLKMARDQQLSLSPNKISGLCGRLLCCLSYEVDQYRSVLKGMPPVGAEIKAGALSGVVTKVDVFNRRIVVRDGDAKESFIPDNAWRPEFLVSSKGTRKRQTQRRSSGKPKRGRGGRKGGPAPDSEQQS